MKKTYIKPATQFTKVAVQQMVCTSERHETINPNETVSDVSSLQSRQSFSVWGEDEEEE